MKRLGLLLFTIFLIATLAACADGENDTRNDTPSVSTESVSAEDEELQVCTSDTAHSDVAETKEINTPKNENDGIDLPIVPNN